MIARVVVTPKPAVNDPQGVTVKQGLHQLGFVEVKEVRVGKFIQISLEGEPEQAGRRVDEMCQKLLANGVIEDYSFELETEEPGPGAGEGRE